jgi:hypothetical protein
LRSTAGRRTRRGNTACRSARTSARSCGRRDSGWTNPAATRLQQFPITRSGCASAATPIQL